MRIAKGIVQTGRNPCWNKNNAVTGPQRLQRLTGMFASFPQFIILGTWPSLWLKHRHCSAAGHTGRSLQHSFLLQLPRRGSSPSKGTQAGAEQAHRQEDATLSHAPTKKRTQGIKNSSRTYDHHEEFWSKICQGIFKS